MSPKPVDLDLAVEALKQDGSTETMRAAARQSLDKPRRTGLPKFAFVGLTAAIAIALLWPRGSSGVAWAQALKASSEARSIHYVVRRSDGALVSEEWTFGKKFAHVVYTSTGKVFHEWRSDGIKTFSYFDYFADGKKSESPNQRSFASMTKKSSMIFGSLNLGGRLDDLLKVSKGSIVSKETTSTSAGPATKYNVATNAPLPDKCLVTVDDRTGLIVELQSSEKSKGVFDYPETIPDETFDPRPQAVNNVEIYDIEKQNEQIKATLKKGLGTSKGVTLRMVMMDYMGAVWVSWSGSPLGHRMEGAFVPSGTKMGPPFSMFHLTSGSDKEKKQFPPYLLKDGTRIYGNARLSLEKIGDRISLSIPGKGGLATFKDVPVMRVGNPQQYFPVRKGN